MGRLAGPHLREAASRLMAAPPVELAMLGEPDLARHLVWILQPSRIVPAADDDEHGATLVLRRRIVDLLRADILKSWADDPPPSGEMLETLERLEAARAACQPVLEQSFAAELADRGGLGLVVEVAHDMRSPLTSILFLSEILHRGQSGSLNDVQKRQVGIIYSAALGLVGMASDMIEVARGGKHLANATPQSFSVNEMLSSVRDLVTPTAEEKGLTLRIERLSSANRLGHPIALSRVLLNLTTNALKFTNEGTVEVSAAAVEGNVVEFSVRDSGPGIAPDALETLYQPFRRVPNRQTGYAFSGTGLGLAICRRLVSAMGSELELESSEGWGTRFSFRLDLPPAPTL
ncbi:MAG TPA: HAMP domain-containing sensor histidine kinase [Longimicrobiales bacterium]|nr:HAMP domain-containing sensor histidine kinase [Longimicrobiales bacterium]